MLGTYRFEITDKRSVSVVEEVPAPILFNRIKHDLHWIEHFIRHFKAKRALPELVLKHIGNSVTDIYTGDLDIQRITTGILTFLSSNGIEDRPGYRDFVQSAGGYTSVELIDGSTWVLREGFTDSRYVHIHPGRGCPHTCRVKASTLKMFIAVSILSDSKDDLDLINAVRHELLGLSPVRSFYQLSDFHRLQQLIGTVS